MNTNDKSSEILPFQAKPPKTKNYKEKLRAGEIRPKGRARKLNQVSPKRRKAIAQYQDLANEWLIGQRCFLCEREECLSVHHKKGRGKYLLATETWVALCLSNDAYCKIKFANSNHSFHGGCHGWVEANHKTAKELGLIE